ncbi:YbfB/YjiJ family MFS transporter [Siccirubricoccus sp. KC 17139]|uniref:YbfB/YjiJ family MFS transporter n=1 Tax=Siccirubricoccus soli TaxID=2899147 RepID=A0ABT1D9D7_9PROT|nr:YbfB/YjiJ family MFS transporter [Siccirubricoccus soli]MCO6417809.1 YbfB/YjiJ family MFS transporter [Siccirubricoccus soli]MCP2683944.1 YbfB/YjiJ family MFS transporter [Siccirubricoccus soli]
MSGFLATALSGAAATCSGLGLARFAYVPLFPAMVAAGWVDGGGAGLLGAANLAGYLAGVLAAPRLAPRLGVRRCLALGMALAALSFAACAANLGLGWFALWRGLSGLGGGFLMGLAGPAVLAVIPASRRGMASGIVVAGVGSGIALGSLLVPLLVPLGLAWAWLGLAAAVLGFWALAAPHWPSPPAMPPARPGARPKAAALLLAYGLSGAGMVAPMVYIADLAARGLGLGLGAGALIWLVFGGGAICGTLLGGRAADRIGAVLAFRLWLVAQLGALALGLVPAAPALLAAAALGGFAGVGVTAVTLALVRQRAGERAAALWSGTSASYGVCQAVVAFALAALFAATGESHQAVFGAGLVLSAGALLVALKV